MSAVEGRSDGSGGFMIVAPRGGVAASRAVADALHTLGVWRGSCVDGNGGGGDHKGSGVCSDSSSGLPPLAVCTGAAPAAVLRVAFGLPDIRTPADPAETFSATLDALGAGDVALVGSLGALCIAFGGAGPAAAACTAAAGRGATVVGAMDRALLSPAEAATMERAASALLSVDEDPASGKCDVVLRTKGAVRVRTRMLGGVGSARDRAVSGEQGTRLSGGSLMEGMSTAERAARAAAALSYEHQRLADAEAGMYDDPLDRRLRALRVGFGVGGEADVDDDDGDEDAAYLASDGFLDEEHEELADESDTVALV